MQQVEAQIEKSPAQSVARLRIFCLVLALLPLAAMLGAVGLAKSDWLMRRGMPAYLQMMDAEWGIRGRSCEVLVFGDSTALTGMMPWVIEQESGRTTCSVAMTKGTVGVMGTTSLERYLENNPAPQVLILAFAPEDWRHFGAWGEVAYVEGALQLVRHGTARQYVTALVTHPSEAFGFATFIYKAALGVLDGHPSIQSGAVRDGQMTMPTAAEQQCATDPGHPPPLYPPDAAYVEQMRQRFVHTGTQVLLLVPPVPDCDSQADWYAARLRGLTNNQLERWPIGLYNDIDRHFTPEGAERFSREVGKSLRAPNSTPGKVE